MPPPPPSSRRSRAVPTGSVPPRPPPQRGASASHPPGAVATDELPPGSSTRAPDSLIPVRFTDLLDERSGDAEPARHGSLRAGIPVLGAFVGGAVVMLALQIVSTRANRAEATHPAPLAQPPAAAKMREELPKPPPAPTAASSRSQFALATDTAADKSLTALPAASAEHAEPATTAEPAQPAATPELAASAALSNSVEDSQRKQQPARPRRKRVRSPKHEPPTAEFPD